MPTPAVPPNRDVLSLPLERMLRHWRRLLDGLAHRHGLDGDEVDEVEQDVRIRLWRLAERGEILETTAASYTYRAVQSSVLDLLRRRRTRERGRLPLGAADTTAVPASSLEADDVERALARALESLDPARRIVVRLHLQGHDRAAIERLLGWSEARVRNLLYRGLEDLRTALRTEAT